MSHGHWNRVIETAQGVVIANMLTQRSQRPAAYRAPDRYEPSLTGILWQELKTLLRKDHAGAMRAWEASPEGKAAIKRRRRRLLRDFGIAAPCIVLLLLWAAAAPP